AGRRPYPWNLVALGIEGGCALNIVAVALLITMQISDIAGDELALDVVPGSGADAIARIDTRLVASLFLADIRVPSARSGFAPPRPGPALGQLGRDPPAP